MPSRRCRRAVRHTINCHAAQGFIENQLANARIQLQLNLIGDAVDRAALQSQDTNFLVGVQAQVNDAVAAFWAQTQAVGVTETASLTSGLAAGVSSGVADLSVAVAGEYVRATAAEQLALAGATVKATTTSGSTDYTSWCGIDVVVDD